MKLLLALVALLATFSHQQIDAAVHHNEQCVACQKWSDFIWNVTNNLDDGLLASLSKVCNDYSLHPGDASLSWCNRSLRRMFDQFKQGWKKDLVCYDIKACTGQPQSDIVLFDLRSPVTPGDDTDCKFCIYMATEFKDMVTGSPFQLELKVHLEDACHYLGGFENECLNLVDNYVDTLFTFINESFVPKDICESIRVCQRKDQRLPSLSEMINLLPANLPVSRVPVTLSETPSCLICKKVVEVIQKELKNNRTEEEIIGALQELCDLFSSKDRTKCKNIINQYVEQLIQILTQDIDSSTACMMVGLCPGSVRHNQILNGNGIYRGNTLCVECELIAHFIQNEMYNYKNEKQLEEFIKKHLCKRMSFIINEPNCQAFVDQYGPIILQTIAQDLFDPDTLCYKEIKVCHKSSTTVIQQAKSRANRKKLPMDQHAGHIRCHICENVVQSLSDVQNFELELNLITIRSCRRFQDKQRAECALMVQSFGPHFLDMIGRYDNPRQICEAVDLCTSGTVQLVGGHKCTYGPSYWCHSNETANACNAYEYCHQNMWESSK